MKCKCVFCGQSKTREGLSVHRPECPALWGRCKARNKKIRRGQKCRSR